MWLLISLAAIAASLLVVLRQVRVLAGDRLAVLVILLIWGRFALTSLGEVATRPLAAGQSLLAIGTLVGTLAALMVLPLERFRTRYALPLMGFLALILVSGLMNGGVTPLINGVVLWLLLLVLTLLLHRALMRHGLRPVVGCLLAVFMLPLAMQVLSFVFGQSTTGQDGITSYIGNYTHGAIYSTVALAGLWLVTLYPWPSKLWLIAAFACVVVGLLMSNYRTLVIATLPLFLALFAQISGPRHLARRVILPLVVGAIVLATFSPVLTTGRYAELGKAFSEINTLVKPPQEFSASEKDLMSARGYIWASYIHEFVNARAPQLIVGFGPGAQADKIDVHPHNEYLRVLYESGLVGFGLWLGLFLGHIAMALRYIPQPAGVVVAAGFASIMIGGLGTSFFNRPEGMIYFAMLCSVTWYLSDRRAAQSRVTDPERRPVPDPFAPPGMAHRERS